MAKRLRGTPQGTNTRRLAASLARVKAAAEAKPKRTPRTRKSAA